jgi:hypothetical protein
MANEPWVAAAEKIMLALVVLCLLAVLAIVGMHVGVVPGCKTTKIC